MYYLEVTWSKRHSIFDLNFARTSNICQFSKNNLKIRATKKPKFSPLFGFFPLFGNSSPSPTNICQHLSCISRPLQRSSTSWLPDGDRWKQSKGTRQQNTIDYHQDVRKTHAITHRIVQQTADSTQKQCQRFDSPDKQVSEARVLTRHRRAFRRPEALILITNWATSNVEGNRLYLIGFNPI